MTVEVAVVIPCYNEEDNVRAIRDAVRAELEQHATSWEIIFIDNSSQDRTRDLLRELCAESLNTRAIFNTRNFGQMRSPTYGIFQADGEAIIALSADFQDPPVLIGPMIAAWRTGVQIVLGQPEPRETGRMATMISRAGYWFLSRYGDYPVIPRVTGFGLFSRTVVDALARWEEPEPFFRGMLVESGYSLECIPFTKPSRSAGKTKNNFLTLVDFALSTLSGSAKRLLRVPLLIALLLGSAAAGLILLGIVVSIFYGITGLATVASGVVTGLFALMMLFIGILGENLRQIAERSRRVPLVLEAERVGFPPDRATPGTIRL